MGTARRMEMGDGKQEVQRASASVLREHTAVLGRVAMALLGDPAEAELAIR